RWHMTLGRFMTNYLYIPLGGNRLGERKTLRNLFIVFMASGIWHGAGWNFVIWGCLHGICILIHRVWKNSGRKMNKLLGWFITINLVNIFWVFFRSETLNGAVKILKGMFDIKGLIYLGTHIREIGEMTRIYRELTQGVYGNKINLILLVSSVLIILFFKNIYERPVKLNNSSKNNYIIVFLFGISIFNLYKMSTFLYFNF
ncbi:MBOAT family O-acyltransferase, partial [uncultured Fusobacterium sp.]|uniref:MBOAT family O-acyltransferase n=1 Tax=uncultured Fusobacterium sp. TaxID=159267 RepID=UPI0025954B48